MDNSQEQIEDYNDMPIASAANTATIDLDEVSDEDALSETNENPHQHQYQFYYIPLQNLASLNEEDEEDKEEG